MTRKSPPKVWLVPVSQVVTYATRSGVMRVAAPDAKTALARAIRFEDAGYNSIEWGVVHEIYEADAPEIAADIQPSELMPLEES